MSALRDDPLPPDLAGIDEPFDDDTLDGALSELESPLAHEPAWRERLIERADVAPVHRWTVTDDGSAEWALRKLAAVQASLAELEERRDQWAAKIAQWFDHASRPLARKATFFAAHLEDYALRRRAETNGQVKTVVLPSGRIATHAGRMVVAVGDEPAFRAWALANPEHPLVRLRPELVKGETGPEKSLRPVEREDGSWVAVLADEGEPVPWARVEMREPTAKAVAE